MSENCGPSLEPNRGRRCRESSASVYMHTMRLTRLKTGRSEKGRRSCGYSHRARRGGISTLEKHIPGCFEVVRHATCCRERCVITLFSYQESAPNIGPAHSQALAPRNPAAGSRHRRAQGVLCPHTAVMRLQARRTCKVLCFARWQPADPFTRSERTCQQHRRRPTEEQAACAQTPRLREAAQRRRPAGAVAAAAATQ